MVGQNFTDCVPTRGWGSWQKRFEKLKEYHDGNYLVIHLEEALTVHGIERIVRFVAGERSFLASAVETAFPDGVVGKKNVRRREDKVLKFEDIPENIRDMATAYYEEERRSLTAELERHGSRSDFLPRWKW